jgi:hypothetical protein
MQDTLKNRRFAGAAGLAGALLFFSGDMLFYGHWGAGATFKEGMLTVLRQGSLTRLFIGGLIGPVAACLCIIGFWHVRQNIVARSPLLGRIVFYALAAMMVAGSALHALWVPRGLAIKYSDTVGPYAPELIAALRRYWEIGYDLTAVPAYFGAIVLAILVVLGKSLYPRWTVLANFGLLSLFAPLAERTPGPLGAILVGGFTNLSIATFFLVSLVSTWNRPTT